MARKLGTAGARGRPPGRTDLPSVLRGNADAADVRPCGGSPQVRAANSVLAMPRWSGSTSAPPPLLAGRGLLLGLLSLAEWLIEDSGHQPGAGCPRGAGRRPARAVPALARGHRRPRRAERAGQPPGRGSRARGLAARRHGPAGRSRRGGPAASPRARGGGDGCGAGDRARLGPGPDSVGVALLPPGLRLGRGRGRPGGASCGAGPRSCRCSPRSSRRSRRPSRRRPSSPSAPGSPGRCTTPWPTR